MWWMICHQRNGVPNSRIINKLEARRWAYKKMKGKKINWVVFAEWTIRDKLGRLNRDKEKADAPAARPPKVVEEVWKDALEKIEV